VRIGILGTRGIPNYHGGFEQFAEHFAVFLKDNGHEVYVYCSSDHPYQEASFKGVKLIHCKDAESKIGTAGQFIYDLNCIRDSRKRRFDILLQLGYTSSTVWHRLLPRDSIVVTNMDGLEWKRSKYNRPVRKFLKYAEKLAVQSSDYLIADSKGIQAYLKQNYEVPSQFIAYGADLFEKPDQTVLDKYQLESEGYDILIARMEPENNIDMILEGAAASKKKTPLLVIGKHDVNSFGKYLTQKYADAKNIRFLGGIYNLDELNNLRYYSRLYFHGHSVGGTNPSLLEAMASHSLIVAHDNQFNRAVLGKDAFYFDSASQVREILEGFGRKTDQQGYIEANLEKIRKQYSWEYINNSYLEFFKRIHGSD